MLPPRSTTTSCRRSWRVLICTPRLLLIVRLRSLPLLPLALLLVLLRLLLLLLVLILSVLRVLQKALPLLPLFLPLPLLPRLSSTVLSLALDLALTPLRSPPRSPCACAYAPLGWRPTASRWCCWTGHYWCPRFVINPIIYLLEVSYNIVRTPIEQDPNTDLTYLVQSYLSQSSNLLI